MEDLHDEEFEPLTVKQVSLKWGLYLGMAMIIYGILLQLLDQVGKTGLDMVNYVFMAALMYFAHKSFKDEGNGYMSYGQGLGIGTLMSVVGSFLSVTFSYIYVKFIDPSFMDIIKDLQIEKMQEQGLSDAQIDQAMEMSAAFMKPEIMFPMAFVFSVFFAFILALIISAITKNPDPSTQV